MSAWSNIVTPASRAVPTRVRISSSDFSLIRISPSTTCEAGVPFKSIVVTNSSLCLVLGRRQRRVVGDRVEADGEPVRRVAGARELVELLDQLMHSAPELGRTLLGDAGVPDERAHPALVVRGSGLLGGDLEVVEVLRELAALAAEADVERARGP